MPEGERVLALDRVLVGLDGPPVWNSIPNVDLEYAVNTNWDLFRHTPSQAYYLRHAGHDGNVYRKQGAGSWQQWNDGGWSSAQGERAGQLDRDSRSRSTGNERTRSQDTYRSSPSRSSAGSYRSSPSRGGGGGRRR